MAQIKRAEIWLEYFDVPNAKKEALFPLLGHSRDYDQKGNPKDHYQKPHPDGFAKAPPYQEPDLQNTLV